MCIIRTKGRRGFIVRTKNYCVSFIFSDAHKWIVNNNHKGKKEGVACENRMCTLQINSLIKDKDSLKSLSLKGKNPRNIQIRNLNPALTNNKK